MVPTSSYPYTSQGPIDFSNLNFTRTVQTEYLDASGTVTAVHIEQSYDPIATFWTITTIFFLAITITVIFSYLISKRSKDIKEAFHIFQ